MTAGGTTLRVYISLECVRRSCRGSSCFTLHILAEKSSEHDASMVPVGSHLMALTSSVCPENFLTGCSSPTLQTKMVLSVEHVANELLFRLR